MPRGEEMERRYRVRINVLSYDLIVPLAVRSSISSSLMRSARRTLPSPVDSSVPNVEKVLFKYAPLGRAQYSCHDGAEKGRRSAQRCKRPVNTPSI